MSFQPVTRWLVFSDFVDAFALTTTPLAAHLDTIVMFSIFFQWIIFNTRHSGSTIKWGAWHDFLCTGSLVVYWLACNPIGHHWCVLFFSHTFNILFFWGRSFKNGWYPALMDTRKIFSDTGCFFPRMVQLPLDDNCWMRTAVLATQQGL